MMDDPSTLPPPWAESLLQMTLRPVDRESISGDLLEQYRDSILPSRGSRADLWYIRQVAGFVWRTNGIWALLFAGLCLARTAYDWRVPTTDFAWRSTVSTWSGVATLFAAGAWGAWRSRSFASGVVTAIFTSQVAAVISIAGAALMLALWHDPQTRTAIAGSGGLGEVFLMPFMMIVPAIIVGALGALLGRVLPP